MDKFKQLLGSRKFWAALIGLGLVVLKAFRPDFPLGEEQLTNLVYVLVAYILGVALEDGLSTTNALTLSAMQNAASEQQKTPGSLAAQEAESLQESQAAKAYHVRLDQRE